MLVLMTTRMSLLYASLVCVSTGIGCSAAGADGPPNFIVGSYKNQVAQPAVVESEGSGPCAVTLNPDSEILEVAERAGQRLTQATGCTVQFRPDGIPVHAWGYVFMDWEANKLVDYDPQLELDQVCGMTVSGFTSDGQPYAQEMYVSTKERRCFLEATLIHEMGHVLAPGKGHAPEGIFAEGDSRQSTQTINEGSLSWLCTFVDCAAYQPE